MASDESPAATERAGGSEGPPGGQMLYQLFAADERRWIVSIMLENHALAFSPTAIDEITDMGSTTAREMLDSLEAAGVVRSHTPDDVLELATSEDPSVARLVGDPDEDGRFYRLDKESTVAQSLAKADSAIGERAREFLEAAPDIDVGE